MTEIRRTQPLPRGPFDLIVVGGGINGVAIARDAALRGHSVALFEKDDLASGTSSASSKMIHGGIRYLEQGRLGLVYESLRERHILSRLAPHLVRPQSFLLPMYAGGRRSPRWIRLGLWLYDTLSLGRRLGRSEFLGPDAARERAPELLDDGLEGTGVYWDAVMDDARLVVATAQSAAEAAAERSEPFVLRTYCEVIEHHATAPIRVRVRDRLRETEEEVTAHRLVYALGPWTDREQLLPSKGIHLVLPRFPFPDGLLLQHAGDGRVFFVVPWRGQTVVGTTETPFDGNPDDVRASADDVGYLLGEMARLFPSLGLGADDVAGIFAGVRPLARKKSWWPFGNGSRLGAASREHRLIDDGAGVFRVFGGKYTTHRAVAREVVDAALDRSSCETHRVPLAGGESPPGVVRSQLDARWADRLDGKTLDALVSRYGARTEAVLELCLAQADGLEPLGPGVLRGEVAYSLAHEFCLTADDFLSRRTTLQFGGEADYDDVERLLEAADAPASPLRQVVQNRYDEQRAWTAQLRRPVGGASGAQMRPES